jgi:hypothetical protein
MRIEKYSLGVGDRFGQEGVAQLRALQRAHEQGALVVPVWNKSFREHSLVGTSPADVRVEADEAVRTTGWRHAHHVDADHVGMNTVAPFIGPSDFFTLDVADYIGREAPEHLIASFVRDMSPFRGVLRIPTLETAYEVTDAVLERIARQYLYAIAEVGRTYRHVAAAKGADTFVTEVSVDEASQPQLPLELFVILGALAREQVPVQTIAPKFSGKFLKGIDYVGDPRAFEREFHADLAVIDHARDAFGLPRSLKLSVHTGSDKFSLYPMIRRAILSRDAGLHLKTAGTTWLEEIVGIALAGERGLALAKSLYAQAMARFEELCKPYATVVEINRARLPSVREVTGYGAEPFARLVRHDPACPDYRPDARQLLHVAFKIAAEMGEEFRAALADARETAGRGVTENLFERHVRPLFLGD